MTSNTNSNRKYYVTALALYFAYFILGIASSIMGQYKTEFAKAWAHPRWLTEPLMLVW